MKKKLFVILVCVSMVLTSVLTGCSSAAPTSSPAPADSKASSPAPASSESVTLKYGHANATTYPYHLAGESFAQAIEQKTNGALKVQIYPMGQLGGERDITEGLQHGTIDLQGSSLGVTAQFVPEIDIFNLPFLFKGADHFMKIMNGDIGKKFMSIVQASGDKVGLKILGIAGPSFRMPMNNVKELKTPADFKGIRIRTMEVPTHMDAYKALGAAPIPIPFGELYTALQTGTVDGNENGAASLAAMKFYEVQKYLSTLPIVSNGGVFIMSKVVYDKLSPDQQKAVNEAAAEWNKRMDSECLKQDKESIELMKEKGVTVTEISDYKPFIDAVQPVYDKYLPNFSPEIQDIVKQILSSN